MSDEDGSDGDGERDYLHCDALPMSCTVELNLVEVLTNGSSTAFSGSSTISYQIEGPTNCLIVHVDRQKVQLQGMKIVQGKHVLRPKCVYVLSAATASASANPAASSNRRPFRWATEEQSPKAIQRGDPPQRSSTCICLSDWKLPRLALSPDLHIIELTQPLSYCSVDIIYDFTSSLGEDHNGIWLSASRAAGTVACGVPLPQYSALVATHFEVDHAHRCFPCVDLVYVRQTVQFVLTVPAHAYCHSNGGALPSANSSCAAATPATATKKEVLPPSVRPIPLYVAGFIASTMPLNVLRQTLKLPALAATAAAAGEGSAANEDEEGEESAVAEEEVECSVVTTYDSQFMAELALKTMVDSVRELRSFLHCALDVPQLCLVALPKLILGGMENDGLIFIKESIGVTNQQQPGQGRRSLEAATKELVRFVVHEVAHHWVGNRIGFSFSWKEGITLVLERYFGNVLLGLPPNQGSKGGGGAAAAAHEDDEGTGNESGSGAKSKAAASSGGAAAAAAAASSSGSGGALVEVDSGKELSGLTYHKAEAAMETAVRKMGWPAFQAGMQKICRLPAGEVVPDSQIPKYFRP